MEPTPLDVQLTALRNAAEQQRAAEESLERGVSRSRELGASWAQIGASIGTTRQAAQQRFGG